MTFHLYGTSLSGLPVDEYAVTDASGVARFENVLISGSTPYTLEEVNTPVRYVVPASQTAPVQWNVVTKRSFTNILKKFRVHVVKSDADTGPRRTERPGMPRATPVSQVRYMVCIRTASWWHLTPQTQPAPLPAIILSATPTGLCVKSALRRDICWMKQSIRSRQSLETLPWN